MNIDVVIDGQSMNIPKQHYVRAKLKQLRAFGYKSLTQEEVEKQLELILSGKRKMASDGIDIIGMFMVDEVKSGISDS